MIVNTLERTPQMDIMGHLKWNDFFTSFTQEDYVKISLSSEQVSFINNKTRPGNGIAHGENKKRIAVAITALQAKSSREMWNSLFRHAFGEDSETCVFE
jgi:hypothetical protein